MKKTEKPVVLIIAGPTAGGKSARALAVAQKHNGIIINADSMQIYNALPLLTAQPTQEERAQSPHTLYATLPPQEPCSAQKWRAMAAAEINKAHASGQLPIITGGTGFYIRALTEGFSPVPEIPLSVREEGNELQKRLGNPAFHAELEKRDPAMAARLHPNDTQRLIRAWEVLEFTGTSLAQWQEAPATGAPAEYDFKFELILPERAELRARCDRRFDTMITSGALDEARQFHEQIESGAVSADAAVTHALGFRPLQKYLRGEISFDEAVTLAKTETKQYAKRQATWFRNQVKKKLSC